MGKLIHHRRRREDSGHEGACDGPVRGIFCSCVLGTSSSSFSMCTRYIVFSRSSWCRKDRKKKSMHTNIKCRRAYIVLLWFQRRCSLLTHRFVVPLICAHDARKPTKHKGNVCCLGHVASGQFHYLISSCLAIPQLASHCIV